MNSNSRHSQVPCVDIAQVVPELSPLRRSTVRLHPRRGNVPSHGSKVGGLFLWPSAEMWPQCHDHDCPLVPILQLRQQDVPELGFPQGTDLFQLLWCPHDHMPYSGPEPQVFWRTASSVANPMLSPLVPTSIDVEESTFPTPCQLFPERVIEYPHAFELSDDNPELWALINNSAELQKIISGLDKSIFEDAGTLYQYCLSVADGTKVGGYVNWCQSPEIPLCDCGAAMEHLLTIDDSEFDGGTWPRWLAQEDVQFWSASPDERFAVQRAADFSHFGDFYLFICRNCQSWPVKAVFQCD